ncbi:hypothetical protein ONS95_005917 [Cadophora gregata]|uniref:uncharacterized protein n=1 Tax=Cadophora gregata TaxID=51156 RepID=UPI0026DBD882|nr:uncharacterized protein ONS95_005917 [Cadophora gregata]KAK0102294.1 hypothetical protein ONS95_005917 [Cadophora gregata]
MITAFIMFVGTLKGGSGFEPSANALPSFAILFIIALTYQALLVYDTLAQKNTMQLLGLCFYAACLCVYAGLQYNQVDRAVEALEVEGWVGRSAWSILKPSLITIILITGLYLVAICCISVKLYGEFQWTIYKQLNADLDMQNRYLDFKIYICLLKFDLFFFLGLMCQFITMSTTIMDVLYILTFSSLPVICITLIASASCMRHESKTGMLIVLAMHTGIFAWFIYMTVLMYLPSRADDFLPARKQLSFFVAPTLILEVATIGMAIKCMRNFDKGLKVHVTGQSRARQMLEEHEADEMEMLMLRESNR